eukprot:scaffold7390_cov420-Prasinococcus_capsulatus_cf.AAC.7
MPCHCQWQSALQGTYWVRAASRGDLAQAVYRSVGQSHIFPTAASVWDELTWPCTLIVQGHDSTLSIGAWDDRVRPVPLLHPSSHIRRSNDPGRLFPAGEQSTSLRSTYIGTQQREPFQIPRADLSHRSRQLFSLQHECPKEHGLEGQ